MRGSVRVTSQRSTSGAHAGRAVAAPAPRWPGSTAPVRPARTLAALLRIALLLTFAVAVAEAAILLAGHATYDDQRAMGGITLNQPLMGAGAEALALASVILLGVTGILWIAWSRRLEQNAPGLGGGEGSIGPRGAVLWWFVPVANLFVPFGLILGLDRRLADDEHPARDALTVAWWLGFLVAAGAMVLTYIEAAGGTAPSQELLDAGLTELLWAVAALLAILVVSNLQGNENGRVARNATWTAPVPNVLGAAGGRRGLWSLPGAVQVTGTQAAPGARPAATPAWAPASPSTSGAPAPAWAPASKSAVPAATSASSPDARAAGVGRAGVTSPRPVGAASAATATSPATAGSRAGAASVPAAPPRRPVAAGAVLTPAGGAARMSGGAPVLDRRFEVQQRRRPWRLGALLALLIIGGAWLLPRLLGGAGGTHVAAPTAPPLVTPAPVLSSATPVPQVTARPSPSPAPASPSTPVSPSAAVLPTLPNAADAAPYLLDHVTAGDGTCQTAAPRLAIAGTLATITCHPSDAAVGSLAYGVFASSRAARAAYDHAVAAAGVRPGSGGCSTADSGETGFATGGAVAGRVLCYQDRTGGSAVPTVVWVDERLAILGWSTGSGGMGPLYAWWKTSSGPK